MSACETPPEVREHDMYFGSDEWTVADLEGVDRLFVATLESGEVRVDIDARAAASAEIADRGDRVNVSLWLDAEQQEQLVDALTEAGA
jgi:hypothetical protein